MSPDDVLGALAGGGDLLGQMDTATFVSLFWYTLVLELPRYVVGAVLIGGAWALRLVRPRPERPASSGTAPPTFSVVIAGNNEAAALRRCVRSILDQTAFTDRGRGQIVVVDDGSTDDMRAVMVALKRAGMIDVALSVRLRGGKSAAVNLALSQCRGECVIIADVDTSFDRDAFARLLSAFDDPSVGAAGGTLLVRNARASLTTRFQAIEYLISISLGRQVSEMLGILSIISGAFGAFRRSALEAVGGQDVEVGEDADLTVKMLSAGWRIAFVPEARSATDVPATPLALLRQRLRWDRGIVTIWARKYRSALNPFRADFRIARAAIFLDIVLFQFVLSAGFLVYLGWIFFAFGAFGWVLLAATTLAYAGLGLLTLVSAGTVDRNGAVLGLLLYVPYYTVFNCLVMRTCRVVAIFDELIFRRSYRDPYVPARVMLQVERF
jgi:cellulose synthase/poly-beta-1,6-N-acetylglucosamine synthase-like glycosyltransferase